MLNNWSWIINPNLEKTTRSSKYMVNKIIRSTEEDSCYYTALFFDMKKAFDKIWHKRLLKKLRVSFSKNLYPLIYFLLFKQIFLRQNRKRKLFVKKKKKNTCRTTSRKHLKPYSTLFLHNWFFIHTCHRNIHLYRWYVSFSYIRNRNCNKNSIKPSIQNEKLDTIQ